ncbi:MAG TPA: DUF1080 domain-containing protein [Chitinophagaceae bacterium]|nr:DUF1080 domain-containing protein [Chitinophagaceae bacterium]
MKKIMLAAFSAAFGITAFAQQPQMKPEQTEFYSPVPPVVTPGATPGAPPSDAVILFDGKSLDEWVNVKDTTACSWVLHDGMMTVNKATGDIMTKKSFSSYQMHIEYQIPADITGSGQARGNSGIFLAALPWGAGGYELQVLDNYNNKTYTNGQVGSMYKQAAPLANACRPPGEWQAYDIIWNAPQFAANGQLISPAHVTVLHNGVLVENNFTLLGDTPYIGYPSYHPHGPAPIKLQAHGDPSKPISYRNIWVRPL